MTLLLFSVAFVLIVSGACSLTEAALYGVRMPYIRRLLNAGSRAGRILQRFKSNMEQPITAILIVNTVANTAGATVAGAQARSLFGDAALIWFSALFTTAVLVLAEIMPKIAGVSYSREVARITSTPLNALVGMLRPLVWMCQRIATVFPSGKAAQYAPEEEVYQLATLSAEEGSILPEEADLVRNVLRLNDVMARDIMTPRTVVRRLAADRTLREVAAEIQDAPHARLPVYDEDDPDNWVGVVLRRDILARLSADDFDATVRSLARPIHFVPETQPGHLLLNEFVKRRRHLFGVIDEFGGIIGVVTLEDVLESLIGHEIVDETDTVVDLQEEARRLGEKRGLSPRPGAEGQTDSD